MASRWGKKIHHRPKLYKKTTKVGKRFWNTKEILRDKRSGPVFFGITFGWCWTEVVHSTECTEMVSDRVSTKFFEPAKSANSPERNHTKLHLWLQILDRQSTLAPFVGGGPQFPSCWSCLAETWSSTGFGWCARGNGTLLRSERNTWGDIIAQHRCVGDSWIGFELPQMRGRGVVDPYLPSPRR